MVAKICIYCGCTEEQTGVPHEKEHFVPRHAGGKKTVISCRPCNRAKGGRIFATLEDCRIFLHYTFWNSDRKKYKIHRVHAFGGKAPLEEEIKLGEKLDRETAPIVTFPKTHLPQEEVLATGEIPQKLRLAGRPREGQTELYVILEEPGEPVQVHYVDGRGLMPHFKQDCPYCEKALESPKALYYVGAISAARELVILELTPKCFKTLEAEARRLEESQEEESELTESFVGLLVKISRGNFARSPRVLRCEQRVEVKTEWAYQTRHELARIWGIAVKPKIYREQA